MYCVKSRPYLGVVKKQRGIQAMIFTAWVENHSSNVRKRVDRLQGIFNQDRLP